MSSPAILGEVLALLSGGAGRRYDGEDVTQLEHALQAAALARADGAPEPLQVAALLHDIGHARVPDAGALSRRGIDARHERTGARMLSRWFGPAVTGPVGLHVAAKRYLVRDPGYALSEESRHTLALQGGPMGDGEARAFLANRWARDAIRLRRWDEAAKVVGLEVPGLEAWGRVVRRVSRI